MNLKANKSAVEKRKRILRKNKQGNIQLNVIAYDVLHKVNDRKKGDG